PARPPLSPLFPYTTLFRSVRLLRQRLPRGVEPGPAEQRPDQHPGQPAGQSAEDRSQPAVGPGPAGPARPAGRIAAGAEQAVTAQDRKSTRLNSSHRTISYA